MSSNMQYLTRAFILEPEVFPDIVDIDFIPLLLLFVKTTRAN